MKPGFLTSEMTLAGVCAWTIFELAGSASSWPDAIARSAGCLALAGVSLAYTAARGRLKRGGG